MDAHLLTHEPSTELLGAARSVYAAAFAEPPYREGTDEAAAFVERIRRYARERDGLRGVPSPTASMPAVAAPRC